MGPLKLTKNGLNSSENGGQSVLDEATLHASITPRRDS